MKVPIKKVEEYSRQTRPDNLRNPKYKRFYVGLHSPLCGFSFWVGPTDSQCLCLMPLPDFNLFENLDLVIVLV